MPSRRVSPAPAGEMRLHVLAVGQADAMVLELPSRKLAVIDFGHPLLLEHLARLDPARKRRYAFCLLTHAHHDHAACLQDFLLRHDRQVEEYWFSFTDPGNRAALLALRAAMIRSGRGRLLVDDAATPVQPIPVEEGVEVVRFAPHTEAVLRPPGFGGSMAENNRSVVLLLRHGQGTVLLGADAEAERWWGIVRQARMAGISLASDLIKPSHHGAAPPHGMPEELWPEILVSPTSVVTFSVGRERDRPHRRTIELVRTRATIRCTGRALTCKPLPGPHALVADDEQDSSSGQSHTTADLFARALLPAPETVSAAHRSRCFGTQIYRIDPAGGVTLLQAQQPVFLDACQVTADQHL